MDPWRRPKAMNEKTLLYSSMTNGASKRHFLSGLFLQNSDVLVFGKWRKWRKEIQRFKKVQNTWFANLPFFNQFLLLYSTVFTFIITVGPQMQGLEYRQEKHRVRHDPQKICDRRSDKLLKLPWKLVLWDYRITFSTKDRDKQKIKLRNDLVNRGFNGWYLVSNWLTT